jgi:hypothetical protein
MSREKKKRRGGRKFKNVPEERETPRNTQSENEREGHGVVQRPNSDGPDANMMTDGPDVDMVAEADMVAVVLSSFLYILPISSLQGSHHHVFPSFELKERTVQG